MSKTATFNENPELFIEMLRLLFENPCLILMLGEWRQGKTDTSLLIAWVALKLGIIDRVASNIYTFNNPMVDEVTNLPRLKRWIHQDRSVKLYIFDEALAHLPSRRAMSKKNVDFMIFLAELSKGHGRVILCSQSRSVDSILKRSEFLRAEFEKESKKVMVCRSNLFPQLTFRDIPKSPIRFDKDLTAKFSELENLRLDDTTLEYRVAHAYAIEGKTLHAISQETGIHRQKIKRTFQKALKSWLLDTQIRVTPKNEFEKVVVPQAKK